MIVSVNYEVSLRNNNKVKGTIKAKVGESLDDIKCRILSNEGFKNLASFIHEQTESSKVIRS